MRNLLIILGLFALPLTAIKAADAQGYKHKIPVHEKVTRGCGGKEGLDDCKALACEIAKRRALEKVGITSVKALSEAELQNKGTPNAQLRLMKEQLSSIAEGKLTEIKIIQNTVANDLAICELEVVVLSNSAPSSNVSSKQSANSLSDNANSEELTKLLATLEEEHNKIEDMIKSKSGRVDEAVKKTVLHLIERIDVILETYPTNSAVWGFRGEAAFLIAISGDSIDSEFAKISAKSFSNAIKFDDNNAEYWSSYGTVLLFSNEFEKALDSCDKAIKKDVNSGTSWACHGLVLNKLNRYEESIESLSKSLKLNSNNALVWFTHGVSLSRLKRYEEAINSYNKALKISPNSPNSQTVKEARKQAVQEMAR